MTKPIDLEAFLDKTFFALDTLSMLGDIEDFIDFSEKNIDWQKRRELTRVELACSEDEFDDPHEAAQYHAQTIHGVVYRFEVSLAQRVRYAALVSLITTIEWVLLSLARRTIIKIPKKPDGASNAVHILDQFNRAALVGLTSEIQTIETLAQVRNCIVHAAGLLASYRYDAELRHRLSVCDGIRVSDINFLGDAIEIEPGYLQGVVEKLKLWLPNLEHTMDAKGLLHKSRPVRKENRPVI